MGVLLDQYERPIPSTATVKRKATLDAVLKARFDAAVTNAENAKHWAMADSLDANSAASPLVRQTLRNRARYEFNNNSFLKGIVLTLANLLIGRGPRLRVLTENKELNYFVEAEFAKWAKKIDLAGKLRAMRIARVNDGEAFAHQITNPRLSTRVQLDICLTEAEQFSHPYSKAVDEDHVDGIEFDKYGNPVNYIRLRYHPGGLSSLKSGHDTLSASDVIHWFRVERPGQRRGIPETTPALPLFSQVRRWELAVVAAAETAADFAAVMYTDLPPGEEAVEINPDAAMEIERRTMPVLPYGWKMSQFKAEQPGTTFKEFQGCMWGEAARCILMPYNVAAGNSSGFNFASGRLDSHGFTVFLEIERDDCERRVADPIYEWWLDEALLIPGYLPGTEDEKSQLLDAHSWGWDSAQPTIDQAKQANANLTRLKTGTASRESILRQDFNVDIDDHDKRAAEDFGVDVPTYRKMVASAVFGLPAEPVEVTEDEEEEEEVDV